MSTEVAAKPTTESQMSTKEDDAGGGSAVARNESMRLFKLKRKSDEANTKGAIAAKKPKKHWKAISKGRNKVPRWKKFPKKPRSLDGDHRDQKPKRRQRRLTESFNAPFNSTQFLMSEHVPDAIRHLESPMLEEEDSKFGYSSMAERPVRRITRARESSFSIDSDEDYYYSSPEDEEEFMSREFIKDYDNVRTDRLVDMSKAELINEYLQMEQKIEALEKRLKTNKALPKKEENNDEDEDTIRQFQKEIQRLETENDRLKAAKGCSSCSCSSDDSDSDSDSSSSSSSSSEDEEEEPITIKKLFQDVSAQDDTGYESGQSKANGLDPNEEKEVVVRNQRGEQHMISVNCITSTSP